MTTCSTVLPLFGTRVHTYTHLRRIGVDRHIRHVVIFAPTQITQNRLQERHSSGRRQSIGSIDLCNGSKYIGTSQLIHKYAYSIVRSLDKAVK